MISRIKLKRFSIQRPRSFNQFLYRIRGGRRIFLNGIPKCGTHLLLSAIDQLDVLNNNGMLVYFGEDTNIANETKNRVINSLSRQYTGTYYYGHLYPNTEIVSTMISHNFQSFLIIRDPRDLVCAHVTHALKRPGYRFHEYYTNTLKNHKSRIITSIEGLSEKHIQTDFNEGYEKNPLDNINDRFIAFLPWQNFKFNLTVRFEDLIGAKGGGDDSVQLETFIKMCQHLNIELPLKKAKILAGNIFNSKSNTFNKGQIGAWRDQFDDEVKDIFKSVAGDLLIELGYEINYDW